MSAAHPSPDARPAPTEVELPQLPLRLAQSRSWTTTLWVLSAVSLGLAAVMGRGLVLDARQPASDRWVGGVMVVFFSVIPLLLHGNDLTLFDDRVEVRSLLRLWRTVIPLARARSFRSLPTGNTPTLAILDERGKRVGTLSWIYERPEILHAFLAARLVDLDAERAREEEARLEAAREEARAAGEAPEGLETILRLARWAGFGAVGLFLTPRLLTIAHVRDPHVGALLRLAAIALLVGIVLMRVRVRRFSGIRRVSEQLQGTQLVACLLVGGIIVARRPVILDGWRAAAVLGLLGALATAGELAIHRRARTSAARVLGAAALAISSVAPVAFEANELLALAPSTPVEAFVRASRCEGKSPSVTFRAADGSFGGSIAVDQAQCAQLTPGTRVDAERVRGALGVPFVRVTVPDAR